MTLFKQWQKLMENQNRGTFNAFWKEYSGTETRVYQYILANSGEHLKGKFSDLVEKFSADPVIFMGFLDGINTSLNTPNELNEISEDTDIDLDINFESLYFNMLKADADYLYTLSEWDGVLTEERRREIEKEYKDSRTVRKEKVPGRNDPCPCGSGKKYKNCCGARV